jgi:hypothetical protein
MRVALNFQWWNVRSKLRVLSEYMYSPVRLALTGSTSLTRASRRRSTSRVVDCAHQDDAGLYDAWVSRPGPAGGDGGVLPGGRGIPVAERDVRAADTAGHGLQVPGGDLGYHRHAETAGGAAVLRDPSDQASIVWAITEAASSRDRLREAALRRAREFT